MIALHQELRDQSDHQDHCCGCGRCDLARLTRNQLITRRPHANTYDLTPDGLAFAIFYTKVHDRVLAPLFAAERPQAPELRAALHTI